MTPQRDLLIGRIIVKDSLGDDILKNLMNDGSKRLSLKRSKQAVESQQVVKRLEQIGEPLHMMKRLEQIGEPQQLVKKLEISLKKPFTSSPCSSKHSPRIPGTAFKAPPNREGSMNGKRLANSLLEVTTLNDSVEKSRISDLESPHVQGVSKSLLRPFDTPRRLQLESEATSPKLSNSPKGLHDSPTHSHMRSKSEADHIRPKKVDKGRDQIDNSDDDSDFSGMGSKYEHREKHFDVRIKIKTKKIQ